MYVKVYVYVYVYEYTNRFHDFLCICICLTKSLHSINTISTPPIHYIDIHIQTASSVSVDSLGVSERADGGGVSAGEGEQVVEADGRRARVHVLEEVGTQAAEGEFVHAEELD